MNISIEIITLNKSKEELSPESSIGRELFKPPADGRDQTRSISYKKLVTNNESSWLLLS